MNGVILKWEPGPELLSRHSGCISRAEGGGHQFEIHRRYERSLISGRGIKVYELHVDGKRHGERQGDPFAPRALAMRLLRGEA